MVRIHQEEQKYPALLFHGYKEIKLDIFVYVLREKCTFQCWSSSCDPAGALCRSRGSSGAEVCVARPRSDRPLVGQAASCRATLPETLDGPSLDSSPTGHRALRQRLERNSGEREGQKQIGGRREMSRKAQGY